MEQKSNTNSEPSLSDDEIEKSEKSEISARSEKWHDSIFGNSSSKSAKSMTNIEGLEDMETTKIESAESALNEYFKLKNKYESDITKNKKTIMNNITLSNKEKRLEYLKLKPKCINCKRPGGTIFTIKHFPYKEKENSEYREFRARCGIIANPCNLNITIQTGIYNSLPEIIHEIEGNIKESKNEIIDSKNKLLFGFITTETALKNFDDEKEIVESYTSLLEDYLSTYIKITDNVEKKIELDESLEKSYELIQNIKQSIQKFNETENTQFVKDAVDIYINILLPLLRKIMALKYRQSIVYYNTDDNKYHLIQNKNTIKSLEYTSFVDKVVNYDVGYTPILNKPISNKPISNKPISNKPISKGLIIESSDDDLENMSVDDNMSTGEIFKLNPNLTQEAKFTLKPSIIDTESK